MVDDPSTQKELAKSIVHLSLSVREAERLIKKSVNKRQPAGRKAVTSSRDPNLISAETKLRRRLGTNVEIIPAKTGTGGRIEIEYYTMADLDRIFETIIDSQRA